jgi:uncharacterized membrane protein HdeD (DUF308 family)
VNQVTRATSPTGDVEANAARYWWMFLITGTLWIAFSLIVFRFDIDSVTGIGIAVGAVCIAAGVNQFLAVRVSSGGWKAVRALFGVLFVIVGIVALAYPNRTFVEVAAIFAFFLMFKGVFDVFTSLISRHESDLWWTGLIVGVIEILLAFWCAGNFGREAVLLVVWVGAGALAHGIMEIVLAIRLYGLRRDTLPGAAAPA